MNGKIFKSRFINLIKECISNSWDVRLFNKIGKRIDAKFDFHKASGISEKMIVQPMDAARIFVNYFFENDLQFKLINELIYAHLHGVDGYSISIFNFNGLVDELEKLGYVYDNTRQTIVQIDNENILPNWGYLEEGKEYHFCFISIDIVENSKIVRKNVPSKIKDTYRNFYEILKKSITRRDGRIWVWEGDGGIITFQGESAINRAMYSILDFILNLPVYNCIYNLLNQEIVFRTVIHPGKAIFMNDINKINSEALDRLLEIEKSYTKPGNIVISKLAWQALNPTLQSFFTPIENLYYFQYEAGRKLKNG